MTRLIDADALIDTLYDHEFASYIDKGEVSTVINDEPTVDAVPVIRCKDCKRCQNSTVLVCGKPKEIFYCDGARKMAVAQYDYCSWAERKEE